MKNLILVFVLLVTAAGSGPSADNHELLKKLVDRALENDKATVDYGFQEKTVVKDLDSDNKLNKQESRTYRTVWIENKPYAELLKINDKPPGDKDKEEETKRRQKFVDSLHQKSKKKDDDDDDFDLSWENLSQKYTFTEVPSDDTAPFVLHFEPKPGDLPERSKMERVFNNMSGTVWANDQYDLLKAQTSLVKSVKFGLGLVAKLDKLDIVYTQTRFENVLLPEHFNMRLNLHIALFKTKNQQVEITFSDYFHRPS